MPNAKAPNSSPRAPESNRTKRRLIGIFASLFAMLAAAAIVYTAWKYQRDNDPIQRTKTSDERFEQRVRAAAFLENVQYDRALEIYDELLHDEPKSLPILRNRAIASLANVKYHVDLAQDQQANDVEKIRAMLPGLFDDSATAIAEFIAVAPEDPIGYQLSILRDIRWISVLAAANPIIADEEQARLFEKLQEYVGKFPSNTFLVTQFSNAAESLSAVNQNALEQTVEPLKTAHQAHPRNLYLLCVLIQRLVQLKNPAALDYVEPLAKLLEPFEWKWKMERRPRDLSDLRRATEIGKSNAENAMSILIGWVGEAKSTEGSLVDAKSIDVNELAFLDLSDVQKILQNRPPKNAPAPPPAPTLTSIELPEPQSSNTLGTKFYDWNVDTQPEILLWSEKQLTLGALDPNHSWTTLASLDLPWTPTNLLAADLFAVDAHRGTPAPRSPAPTSPSTRSPDSDLASAMRHETIRDLILFGEQGIAIVLIGPPNENKPTWSILNENIGLEDLKNVSEICPIDWESDGDLDLAIIADGKLVLRENTGNRKFRDVGALSLLPEPNQSITALCAVDLDRDVDLDLVVSSKDSCAILENIQHGQFRFRELFKQSNQPDPSNLSPLLANANSLCIADVNGDYSWDILAGSNAAPAQIALTSTDFGQIARLKNSYTLTDSPAKILVGDWNNDALIDAFALSDSNLTLLLNQGNSKFTPIPLLDPITSSASANNRFDLGDWQADGWLDLLTISNGKLVLISSTPIPDHYFLTYRVKGISDANGGGRNNQYAVGSTVEIYGPFGYQARIIQNDSVHFGLANHPAYSLRTIFVNGLTQGIIDPKPNEILEEKQVLIGSCPFLYGFNGTNFELVTDLLWNAPLGLQIAKGKVLPDRRWEYLSLPRNLMLPHKEAYELRITEELWESAYFDHISLLAIDHPPELEWISNEKVGPPNIAQPLLWGFDKTYPPQSVTDAHGINWLDATLAHDGTFAIPFQKQLKQGLVEPSYLELDFGSIDLSKPAQLILTGWIYPTDTSLNISIDQNDDLDPPAPLAIWTPDSNGSFQPSIPFTGFPGGKPKTIVIPLDKAFLSEDHRIRLVHSSQMYFDQIRLGYGKTLPIAQRDDPQKPSAMESHTSEAASLPTKLHWLPILSSELHYRGFSLELPRSAHSPHWYDYNTRTLGPAWPPLRGKFTRYGNVLDLISFNDDTLVVMAPGDEMIVRFELPKTPIPEGWVRDFVLHSVGWDKDAAMNTLEGQSSLPLPFSTMQQYPPGQNDRPEAARIDRIHRDTLTREQQPAEFWQYKSLVPPQ